MRILIVGAGAIGALYGVMLQKAGGDISVYCRSGCDEIKRNGIRVNSIWGDSVLQVNETYGQPEIPSKPFDLVLVSTKVLPEVHMAEIISPFVNETTTILLIQNGLHIEKPYSQLFPKNELLSALAFVCSNRLDYCHVEHLDYGRIVIGRANMGESDRFTTVASMLEIAGVPVEISENIERDRWIKLIWNVPFNPLSVLGAGASTDDILNCPETRNLAQKLMEEIIAIAGAAGYELENDLIRIMMERTEKMKPYRTSMLLDYDAGRQLETDAIVGEPLREAERLGISAPHLESVHALLLLADRQHME